MYPLDQQIQFDRNREFADTLAAVQDHDAQDEAMQRHLAQHHGVVCFNFALVPKLWDGSVGEYIGRSTLTPNVLGEYKAHNLWRTDTFVHHCFHRHGWFFWSRLLSLPTNQLTVADQWSRDVGLIYGVTISLKGAGPFFGGISLVGDPDATGKTLEKYMIVHKAELEELVHLYYAHLENRRLGIDHYNLTDEHIKILCISAHGFPIKQIAHRLDFSKAKVRKLQTQIRKRFEAPNMTLAVYKAAALGVI